MERLKKKNKKKGSQGDFWVAAGVSECYRDIELKVKVRIVWLATWKLYL